MDSYSAAVHIQQSVHRMFERGSLLNQMVAYQAKSPALGKYDGFIMKRAILEMKHQAAAHGLVFVHVLNQIAGGKSLPVQGTQNKETVNQTFLMTNRDLLSPKQTAREDKKHACCVTCETQKSQYRHHFGTTRSILGMRRIDGRNARNQSRRCKLGLRERLAGVRSIKDNRLGKTHICEQRADMGHPLCKI